MTDPERAREWCHEQLARAREHHDHDTLVLLRWREEEDAKAREKISRLFLAEGMRIESAYAARVRYLEGELERLGGGE